ncbi:MAG: helix-turn-helix domain-containing protein [Chloroflexota bacterium]
MDVAQGVFWLTGYLCRPTRPTLTSAPTARYDRAVGDVTSPAHGAPSSSDWLSTSQAGKLLGVSSRSVGRWIQDGKLRGRRTEAGQFRVTRGEVERLAAEQESRALQTPAQTPQRRKEDRTAPAS